MEFWRRTMTKIRGTTSTTVQLPSKTMINCSNCFYIIQVTPEFVLFWTSWMKFVCEGAKNRSQSTGTWSWVFLWFTVLTLQKLQNLLKAAKFVLWVKPRTNLVSRSLDPVWIQTVRHRTVCPWGGNVKHWSNTTNSLWGFILITTNSTINVTTSSPQHHNISNMWFVCQDSTQRLHPETSPNHFIPQWQWQMSFNVLVWAPVFVSAVNEVCQLWHFRLVGSTHLWNVHVMGREWGNIWTK